MRSLRLIAWNCRSGSLATRLSELADHTPDIVFVQECTRSMSLARGWQFVSRPVKGTKAIALGSLNPDYRIAELEHRTGCGKAVIAAAVSGRLSFTVLGIWSQSPDYVDDVLRSVEAYATFLRSGPSVVLGDLNSGTCLYRQESPSKNHLKLIRALGDVGLVSAYHSFHAIEHGRERHATYRHQFRSSQPWHIDFCFVPTSWKNRLLDVSVLDGDKWEGRSDHFPLAVDVVTSRPRQPPDPS